MPHRAKKTYNLIVCPPESDRIKNLKATYRRVQTLRIA